MISTKYHRYIGNIGKISETFLRFFQNINGLDFDFLTSDLTAQIGSCFNPIVHILSTILKASNYYFFYPTIAFKSEA